MTDQRIEDLGDDLAVPRKNGELVFEAPWEGRVFGMAVVLSDDRVYAWDDFRDHLVGDRGRRGAWGRLRLLRRWLASFERLLLDSGVVTATARHAHAEFAAGVYDEHEHYETTSDAIASLTRSPQRRRCATSSGAPTGSQSTFSPPGPAVRLRDGLLLRAHGTGPRAGVGGAVSPRVGAAADHTRCDCRWAGALARARSRTSRCCCSPATKPGSTRSSATSRWSPSLTTSKRWSVRIDTCRRHPLSLRRSSMSSTGPSQRREQRAARLQTVKRTRPACRGIEDNHRTGNPQRLRLRAGTRRRRKLATAMGRLPHGGWKAAAGGRRCRRCRRC